MGEGTQHTQHLQSAYRHIQKFLLQSDFTLAASLDGCLFVFSYLGFLSLHYLNNLTGFPYSIFQPSVQLSLFLKMGK